MAWIGMTGRSASEQRGKALDKADHPASFVDRDDRPTILVAGMAANDELSEWIEQAGLRCIGVVPLYGIAQRLTLTIAVDLILVDLRNGAMDAPTARALATRHGLADTGLAVITDLAGLDLAVAQFEGPATEILCEPAKSDIIELLVIAAAAGENARAEPQLHDPKGERARIDQLSAEVRRLASTIDRLTSKGELGSSDNALRERNASFRAQPQAIDEHPEVPPLPSNGVSPTPAPTPGEIRALLRARRMREQFLPGELFADPAWDMILDLMAARLAGQRVSVSSLCIAAAVPPTTALRWIRQLTERGVFARIDDPVDGRRVFIELTDDAANAFTAWVAAVRRTGGLLAFTAPR